MALPLVALSAGSKVYAPDGRVVTNGRITCTLSQSGSVLEGAVSQHVAPVAVGKIGPTGIAVLALTPNDVITPSGTSYSVLLEGRAPSGEWLAWTVIWQFASTPNPIDVGAVTRLNVIPGVALAPSLAAAQAQADAAATARDQALAAGKIYPDTATGLAATVEGAYFLIPSPVATESYILYRKVSGAAVETKRYALPLQNWYVDSVSGSDAADGKTATTSLQTIAALLGKPIAVGSNIWLARGSHWRERLYNLPNACLVRSYGDRGTRPLLDCSSVATNGTFTKTVGRTNVYQIDWAHTKGLTTGRHNVWENGARLTRVADVATCDTTPGSFYAPNPSGTTDTIYIHASDNSSLITNAKIYELSARPAGLEAQNSFLVEGIHTRRNLDNNGSLLAGFWAKNCVAEDGTVHNMGIGGLAEDCLCIGNDYAATAGSHWAFVSFPAPVPSGGIANATIRYRRCRAIGNQAAGGDGGFYAHTDGSANWLKVVYEDCEAVHYASGFGIANTQTVIYDRCSTRDVTQPYTISLVGSAEAYILGGKILGTAGTRSRIGRAITLGGNGIKLTMRGVRFVNTANANVAFVIMGGVANPVIDIQRCSFAVYGEVAPTTSLCSISRPHRRQVRRSCETFVSA